MAKVKVTCYDKVREFKSVKAAIAFYEEGMCSCDPNSSEFDRYAIIVDQLYEGKTEVTDNPTYTKEELEAWFGKSFA